VVHRAEGDRVAEPAELVAGLADGALHERGSLLSEQSQPRIVPANASTTTRHTPTRR